MHIHLNDDDISRMPEQLRSLFLDWLPECLKTKNSRYELVAFRQKSQPQVSLKQLDIFESQTMEEKAEHSHVRLTQLFDAGITKAGMPVRVKLKREEAKKRSRDYINNLEISVKGTIVYNGEEFEKPSPLAAKVNGGAANGWEYIEVKKDNQWICLDTLRKIWRNNND
ncbi:hypothetical protein [Brasilonema bromeliae]|nr:hypothetical protein [Brasilonema bromeliae]